MIGAIIGDIAGSRFEWKNHKGKDFELFTSACAPTDDSIMTLALADAILKCNGNYTRLEEEATYYMQVYGREYPDTGYGGMFRRWIFSYDPKPYNSYGNGAAMRVSPCGLAANSMEEAVMLARTVTQVTHNHPEAMTAAEAVASAIYLGRLGKSLEQIKEYITEHYYHIDFTLDEIRPRYHFDVTCQGSVPQAMEAFFESADFEDAIRIAISVGGDSDTIAAITGSIAEAFYGVPAHIRDAACAHLDGKLLSILADFERRFPAKVI